MGRKKGEESPFSLMMEKRGQIIKLSKQRFKGVNLFAMSLGKFIGKRYNSLYIGGGGQNVSY